MSKILIYVHALNQDAYDSEEEDRRCRHFLAKHGPCFLKREAPTMPVKTEETKFPVSRGRPFSRQTQRSPSLASSAAPSISSSLAPSTRLHTSSKFPSIAPSSVSSLAPPSHAPAPGPFMDCLAPKRPTQLQHPPSVPCSPSQSMSPSAFAQEASHSLPGIPSREPP